MATVDDAIAKHLKRIESHKRDLLDGVASTLPASPPDRPSSHASSAFPAASAARSPISRPRQTQQAPHASGRRSVDAHSQHQPRRASPAPAVGSQNRHTGSPQLDEEYSNGPYEAQPSPFVERRNDASYRTSTPNRIYERTQRWVGSKNAHLERSRQEIVAREQDECTFSPMVAASSSAKRSRSYDPASASRVTTQPDAPSVYLHLQRQEEARREKQYRQRRIEGVDTKNWKPRVTVPKEFTFGQRNTTAIPALRKPVLFQQSCEQHNTEDGGDDDDAEFAPDEDGAMGGSPPTNRAYVSRPRGQEQVHHATTNNNNNQQQQRRRGQTVPEHVQIAELRDTVQSKEHEIVRLNGTVASLQRELDVAKAKIRQLTLHAEGSAL